MDWTSAAVSSNGAYQVPAELTVITTASGVLQVGTVITLTASEHVFSSSACRTSSAACCTATTSAGAVTSLGLGTGTSQVRAITLTSEVAAATVITIKCTNMQNNRAENTAVTWTIQSSTDTGATTGLPGYTVGAAQVGNFDYFFIDRYTSDTCATSLKVERGVNGVDCLVSLDGANSFQYTESKWTNDNSAAMSIFFFVGNTQCRMNSSTINPAGVTIPNPMVMGTTFYDTCVTKTDSNGTLSFMKVSQKLKIDTTVTKIGVMLYSGEGSSVCTEGSPTTYTVFVTPGVCINFASTSASTSTFGAFTVQLATDGTVIMTRYFADTEGVTPAATCEYHYGQSWAITMGKAGDGCFVKSDEATGTPWSFCKNEECVIPGGVVSKAIAPRISALTTTVATFGAAVLALA